MKVLIVDDDINISELVSLYLQKEGFSVTCAYDGEAALKAVDEESPDLVLLDVMMPGLDGFETLRLLREKSSVPVIMLSAKGEPMDKINGLDYGADDYVTKPFEPQELMSRIRAVMRRLGKVEQSEDEKEACVGDLYVSLSKYVVKVGDRKIDMAPKEIEILFMLAKNPMRVFTRDELLREAWGENFKGDPRTIDVHIKRVREKLGVGKQWKLITVWGVGYKFEVTR